jgi:hypothetical protein
MYADRAIRNKSVPMTTTLMARAMVSPARCEAFGGDGYRHDGHRA